MGDYKAVLGHKMQFGRFSSRTAEDYFCIDWLFGFARKAKQAEIFEELFDMATRLTHGRPYGFYGQLSELWQLDSSAAERLFQLHATHVLDAFQDSAPGSQEFLLFSG